MIDVETVNAYAVGDPERSVVVALRVDGAWRDHRVSHRDAVTLADMLHLLTKAENVESPLARASRELSEQQDARAARP